MIKITPYYKREETEQDAIRREYLRMVAASTPFRAKDILYDDPDGLANCQEIPRERTRVVNGVVQDTAFARLLHSKGVPDGTDTEGKLDAEAELAERIVQEYSKRLYAFLYENGCVRRENLRKLLLLKLPNGQIPIGFRFDEGRIGSRNELKKSAENLREYVFRYYDFSRLKQTDGHCGIHEFVAMLDVKVCPYCNRQFTTTVITKKRRVRPQLDHFRNKHDYPFLALSINNLIPTCGVCNLLKRDTDRDMIYPYDEDFEADDLVFRTTIPEEHTVPALEGISISDQDFEIKLRCKEQDEPTGKERRERIKASIKELCLNELYQSHRGYVSLLYRQRYIYTKLMAQDLVKQFKDVFKSEEEVEQAFVLMYTDYAHWGDRPLSKLTHDILDEIEELYGSADRL